MRRCSRRIELTGSEIAQKCLVERGGGARRNFFVKLLRLGILWLHRRMAARCGAPLLHKIATRRPRTCANAGPRGPSSEVPQLCWASTWRTPFCRWSTGTAGWRRSKSAPAALIQGVLLPVRERLHGLLVWLRLPGDCSRLERSLRCWSRAARGVRRGAGRRDLGRAGRAALPGDPRHGDGMELGLVLRERDRHRGCPLRLHAG